MIARRHRFHGYNALRYVYGRGRTVRGQMMSVKFVLSRRPAYRLAVVVSRKVHKSAVVRNRIRRRLYEIVRRHEAALQPADIVLTVYQEQIASMAASDLEWAVLAQLQEAGLLSPVDVQPASS